MVLLALGCSGPSLEVLERHPNEFLTRQGTELRLRGQPYRFVSFNAFALTGCGNPGEVPSDAQLDDFFAALRPHSLVRTFAFDVPVITGIERVVAAAKAHGHLLILVLGTPTNDCGGTAKGLAFYQSGFRELYLPYVEKIVGRFKDDPAVGMWEPLDSPFNGDSDPNVVATFRLALRNFYDSVGGEIHRIDTNHLVESGTRGPWAYQADDGYAFINASAGIDVASFQDFDTTQTEPPNLAPSLAELVGVGKPLIINEAGMFASIDGDPSQKLGEMPCISWTARRDHFKSWLDTAFATDLAGVDIWNWIPRDLTSQDGCSYTTAPNDPLTQSVHDYPIP